MWRFPRYEPIFKYHPVEVQWPWSAPDVAALRAERDHYRAALVRIADAESCHWGVIAREALRPHEIAKGTGHAG
jgi:hypothetical protein